MFCGYDRVWFFSDIRCIISIESQHAVLVREYYVALSYDQVMCSLCILYSYIDNI